MYLPSSRRRVKLLHTEVDNSNAVLTVVFRRTQDMRIEIFLHEETAVEKLIQEATFRNKHEVMVSGKGEWSGPAFDRSIDRSIDRSREKQRKLLAIKQS